MPSGGRRAARRRARPPGARPPGTCALRARPRAGPGHQPDAEALGRQAEQHLARAQQILDLLGAQRLEIAKPLRVLGGTERAGGVQLQGVHPYFRPRLAQETPGGGLVRRAEQGVGPGPGGKLAQLGILRADPQGQHLVDALVVGAALRDQGRIGELRRADHLEQSLRQVEVDVRVHAQQDVP